MVQFYFPPRHRLWWRIPYTGHQYKKYHTVTPTPPYEGYERTISCPKEGIPYRNFLTHCLLAWITAISVTHLCNSDQNKWSRICLQEPIIRTVVSRCRNNTNLSELTSALLVRFARDEWDEIHAREPKLFSRSVFPTTRLSRSITRAIRSANQQLTKMVASTEPSSDSIYSYMQQSGSVQHLL